MCGRNYGRGSKRIIVLLLCLVLAVSSLTAVSWPWAWKSKSQEPEVIPETQPVVTMVSEGTSWEELKTLLSEREKAFSDLKASYETEVATLKAEITTLQTLSPISTAQYDALVAERDLLKSDLSSKTVEAQGYWEDLVMAKSKASGAQNKIGGMVGAGGTYQICDGKIGAEIEMGARFEKATFKIGLGYMPDVWTFAIPSFDDMTIKAGLQYSF